MIHIPGGGVRALKLLLDFYAPEHQSIRFLFLGPLKSLVCEMPLPTVEDLPKGLSPLQLTSPPHAYPMGARYMTGWVSTSGKVGSNLKLETQTGAIVDLNKF
ncbi:hypothetical protein TNCV_4139291 [Trichonephila clavipes]|nr:hypothetical protein TNCV_4139291 [Trichonephila clavipes]